jgi:hypothetical protein
MEYVINKITLVIIGFCLCNISYAQPVLIPMVESTHNFTLSFPYGRQLLFECAEINSLPLTIIKVVNKSIDLINKHLPNIPPAKEIAQNGIAISDMTQRMMEKIEELTLYVIQQQKEIEQLKQQLKKEGK